MTPKYYLLGIAAVLVVLVVAGLIFKFRPRKINVASCASRWQAVQKYCSDKKTWHLAVTDADRLLDDVLKRRHYKGKTTGERLVSAQHDFTNNESLWFGHKLYNRIQDDGFKKLTKQDTLEALGGFRQALKDLGALKDKIITAPVETVAAPIVIEPVKVVETKSGSKTKPETKAKTEAKSGATS